MLMLKSLNVYYGKIHAIKGVSLHVNKAEIVTLIGANGAGKSSILNAISGLTGETKGSVIFEGEDITKLAPDKIVKRGIVQVPEGRLIFTDLPVKDNLILGAYIRYGKEKSSVINETLDFVYEIFPILKERHNQIAGTLSGGEQQMLAIGRALMAKPRLLLLDEPSIGLAPNIIKSIFNVIRKLNEDGLTMLLVEQNAKMALNIAKRGYVIETGKIIVQGQSDELIENKDVKRAYLGKGYKEVWE